VRPLAKPLVSLLGALLLATALAATRAPTAAASSTQQAMFEDDTQLLTNPSQTIQRLRILGVSRIRVAFRWQYIAPNPTSSKPPKGFTGSDPADYPQGNWAIWDDIVREAQTAGMGIDLDAIGGAPVWALGPGRPKGNSNLGWNPSPSMFRAFVHALGVRYSGDYDPTLEKLAPGDPNDLPRVSFWSVWNEPNYGPSLAPQGVLGHLTIENSPRMYRNLVDAGWTALQQTGHPHDTFIFGELAPRGMNYWGVFSGMRPLAFLRAMYCVDASYRPLRGSAAANRGCPTTAAGSRQFRAQNPALFGAAGISDHPYMRWYPPNREASPDPTTGQGTADYSTLGVIGNLERATDRLQRAYGSPAQFRIWNTEFGYITSPPKHDSQREPKPPYYYPWVSPTTAAYYDNWAEYISWRDPRIASFFQYLLHDPDPVSKSTDWGGYASGLLFWNYSQKPGFSAWRLPLYLPVTTGRRGQALKVWGCLRPAQYAISDTSLPQTVDIQLQPNSTGQFQTVQTVTISSAKASCYFYVPVKFPSSGAVRLTWTYPNPDPNFAYLDPVKSTQVYSRHVQITLR
jgi:hypothetical protein